MQVLLTIGQLYVNAVLITVGANIRFVARSKSESTDGAEVDIVKTRSREQWRLPRESRCSQCDPERHHPHGHGGWLSRSVATRSAERE